MCRPSQAQPLYNVSMEKLEKYQQHKDSSRLLPGYKKNLQTVTSSFKCRPESELFQELVNILIQCRHKCLIYTVKTYQLYKVHHH